MKYTELITLCNSEKKVGMGIGVLSLFDGADFKNDLHFLPARQVFALRGVKVAKNGVLSYFGHDFEAKL